MLIFLQICFSKIRAEFFFLFILEVLYINWLLLNANDELDVPDKLPINVLNYW